MLRTLLEGALRRHQSAQNLPSDPAAGSSSAATTSSYGEKTAAVSGKNGGSRGKRRNAISGNGSRNGWAGTMTKGVGSAGVGLVELVRELQGRTEELDRELEAVRDDLATAR